ncbi:hypothetical protein KC19_7G179000 [Ceratodon purpureus]|uniref:Uncharacterized protein n=1 Tax=Ceratodon purpureus TaxID=3225 RepID=A0A8T0H7T7_CERPU|nr:hypothetical protein KC19_7G179000 [Ceratodon purpureus]
MDEHSIQVSIFRNLCISGAITCSRLGYGSSQRSSLQPTTITCRALTSKARSSGNQ